MHFRVLISPLARAAYFESMLEVARAELEACGFKSGPDMKIGAMDFMDVEAPGFESQEAALSALARVSVVQGVFRVSGEGLEALEAERAFLLTDGLVYGQKYPGKTNELVTQLALNVGLQHLAKRGPRLDVLDPMAGRGTTLMWALRYGMDARGVEIDPKALDLFYGHVKKQCKLSRLKHSVQRGRIGKEKKQGQFARFMFGERKITMVNGDSRSPLWSEGRRFDLVVTDLPYGIQHTGDVSRSPLSVVEACAPVWSQSLKTGGAMVLVFNDYQTRRGDLEEIFSGYGLVSAGFAAPHRMSESIVRDVIVFQRGEDLTDLDRNAGVQ